MHCPARTFRATLLAGVLLLATAVGLRADDPPEVEGYRGVIVEYLRLEQANRIGVPLADGAGGTGWLVTAHVRVRNLDVVGAHVILRTSVDREDVRLGGRTSEDVPIQVVVDRWGSDAGGIGEIRLHALAGHRSRVAWDEVVPVHGTDALTVGLLVERRTFDEGEERFGSFTRRMRQSLEEFHALLDDHDAATPRRLLGRAPIRDRFRIEWVEIYDRPTEGRPARFDSHPDVDLVIACDEGGPLAGFWLPQYAIGHDFLFPARGDGGARKGIWSKWGEHALWHELLHSRGVPDAYLFHVQKAALPGRATADLPLPDAWRLGLMNSPYQEPRLSALTAAVANAKAGVKQVGACEEPDHEHGHMWRWVPKRLRLRVTRDGKPLEGALVRWWASRPFPGLRDPRMQGVGEDALPNGESSTDAPGVVVVEGDYLNRGKARPERSLWLLVEVVFEGERRYDVVRLLDLNEAWAAGERGETTRQLDWPALRLVGDAPLAGVGGAEGEPDR